MQALGIDECRAGGQRLWPQSIITPPFMAAQQRALAAQGLGLVLHVRGTAGWAAPPPDSACAKELEKLKAWGLLGTTDMLV